MSYTAGFLLFWLSLALAVGLEWWQEVRGRPFLYSLFLFWLFALCLISFAAFRPIGIARDDLAYIEIFNGICPVLECGQFIQSPRDWGWYTLIGLLKSVWANPRVMLLVGAAGLLMKVSVIYGLSKKPLPVLLLFVSLYYQAQDITAFRVSLAIAFLMLAIWLFVKRLGYLSIFTMLLSGGIHKQAFVAPLILLGYLQKGRLWLLATLVIAPVLLMILGFYPQLQLWTQGVPEAAQATLFSQGLDSYISMKNAGVYAGWHIAPLVFYPLIALSLWMVCISRAMDERLQVLMAGCLIMGCWFLWGFASLPDAQVRFFEFFMMPTVLLAGMRRLNLMETSALIGLSAIFIAKYNIIHHIFI